VDHVSAGPPVSALHDNQPQDHPQAGNSRWAESAEPIVITSLADEIAFRLETAILDGVYPPGSRLPQEELCERFAVSRTPVREALRNLQAKSLVEVVPNRGATVRLLSRKELVDVYQLRAELEGYSCELAAGRVIDAQFAELDKAQGELEAAVAVLVDSAALDADLAAAHLRMKRANDAFHMLIHRMANNGPLLQVIKNLWDRCPKDYISRALRSSPEIRDLNVVEHRQIRTALGAADAKAARIAMHDHILHAMTVSLRYLDAHGFWNEDGRRQSRSSGADGRNA
jgi:DNA-binding GntR family transcriptional regulator